MVSSLRLRCATTESNDMVTEIGDAKGKVSRVDGEVKDAK
jgi:hypothetical protein